MGNAALAGSLERRGDLTLRGNSLNDALLTISELWQINIVASEVPGAVNGVFKDAPLREILDSILLSNGYGYRAVGESLVVTELDKLGQINPFFESATIVVHSADVNDVASGAQLLSTPGGEIRAIPSASAIFVLDFPDRVKMITDFVSSVDRAARRASGGGRAASVGEGPQQLQVAYLKTHFVEAKDVETVLQTVISPSGRVAAMEAENRLLAVDYAENLQMIATVLERIDRPRPQVSVRALIYDISLQDMEAVGLNWQSLSGGNGGATVAEGSLTAGSITSGTGTVFNSLTTVPTSGNETGSTFNFFTLNSNVNLSAVAVALQQAADSRLLASPNVTVIDNDEATIASVSEIPFQQLTQTAAGGNIGTTAFRDAGVTLTVRPRISMDGTIDMQVSPEFSRLTGFTPGDNQPIIDRRTAQTRVRVANGQTFVIAGLRQRTDVGDFRGVPLLKDVRFFGHLFRGRETDIRESELVVFISPVIVGPNDPLGPRDQATSDTVNCRLQMIPQAEGCPPNCGVMGCASTAARPAPLAGPMAQPIAQPMAAQHGFSPPPQRTASQVRMRPDYDSRYRATGGAYPQQQRRQPAQAAPQQGGFWERLFR